MDPSGLGRVFVPYAIDLIPCDTPNDRMEASVRVWLGAQCISLGLRSDSSWSGFPIGAF